MRSISNFDLLYVQPAVQAYRQLNNSQRRLVDRGLERIRVFGTRCGQVQNGQLAGCRKLVYRDSDLQIIFRQLHGKIVVLKLG